MVPIRSYLRRKEICELLAVMQSLPVAALAERFGVSAMTIRRDLDVLEAQHLLRREHGRAVYSAPCTGVAQYENRLTHNAVEKRYIAQRALKFLRAGQTIYLDGSTTCNTFLELFPDDLALTVYTNSVSALNILLCKPRIKAFIFGGMLSSAMRYLDSSVSLLKRNDLFVDAAFISCTGYDAVRLVNHDALPVNERRVMLKNASTRYLLADSKKQGKTGLFTVCFWDSIDVFITDAAPDEALSAALFKHGVTVEY